jgi:hypothetical protein
MSLLILHLRILTRTVYVRDSHTLSQWHPPSNKTFCATPQSVHSQQERAINFITNLNLQKKKRWSYPCNRPWRPISLRDVEVPTSSRHSAHRWRWGCQPCAPAALYSPGRFLVLISVTDWVDPRAIVGLEGLGQLKKSNDLIGIEPATFHLVA